MQNNKYFFVSLCSMQMTSSFSWYSDYSLCTATFGFDSWDYFPLVSHFCCEHNINTWGNGSIILKSPLLQNPPASSYSPPSLPRLSSRQFPWLPEIFVTFLFSLVSGSLWNNEHSCCSCSHKCPSSILFCNSSWVALGHNLCNNYPLHWICPQPDPQVPLYFLEAIVYHSLSNSA